MIISPSASFYFFTFFSLKLFGNILSTTTRDKLHVWCREGNLVRALFKYQVEHGDGDKLNIYIG